MYFVLWVVIQYHVLVSLEPFRFQPFKLFQLAPVSPRHIMVIMEVLVLSSSLLSSTAQHS